MHALGKRLASGQRTDLEDLQKLESILSVFGVALDKISSEARRVLEGRTLAVTSRVKTTNTIVQKLQRERTMSLKGMRDLAGLRIVGSMSRLEQDDLVALLVATFPGDSRPPRVVDRRHEPSAGYRAVHVVVTTSDLDVEVQVRTELQDLWANSFEILADRWGRELRYGAPLRSPETAVWPGQARETTRGQLLAAVVLASDTIDTVESGVAELSTFARGVPSETAALKRAHQNRSATPKELFRRRELMLQAEALAGGAEAAAVRWQERHALVIRQLERLTTDVV